MAQRGAAIAHTRTDQAIVGILFQRVSDPSRGSPDRENRRGHRARKSQHPHTDGEVKIEVRAQAFALPYDGFNFLSGLE